MATLKIRDINKALLKKGFFSQESDHTFFYLFENRFSKHKDYYSDNYMLLSVFNFTKSVIELYCKLVEI